MKWFFLTSFIAGVVICALLTCLIVFAFLKHVGGLKADLIISGQIVLFAWATREMYRCYKNAGISG